MMCKYYLSDVLMPEKKADVEGERVCCQICKWPAGPAVPLTSMLKTTGSSEVSAPRTLGADGDEVVGGAGGGRADETFKNSSKSKKSKNENSTCIGATGGPIFLNPNAKKAFNRLRQAFIEAPILRHFDPECHIRTYASGYAMGGVLSQLSTDWVNPDEPDSNKSKISAAESAKSKISAKNSAKFDFG